jgi:signal transduction histidine kinase
MSAHGVPADRESSVRSRLPLWTFVAALVVTGVMSWTVVVLAPPTFRTAAAWSLGVFAVLLSVAAAAAVHGYLLALELRADVEHAQADADEQVRVAAEQAQAEVAHVRHQTATLQSSAEAQVRAAYEQARADTSRLSQQIVDAQAAGAAEVRAIRAQIDTEVQTVADEVIPALVKRLESGSSSGTALADVEQPSSEWSRRVVRFVAEHIGRVERTKAAALAACANAASRMQAQSTSMAAELRDMEDTADPATLTRLLEVDHHNAQLGRLADSIAVLTGARSGRRWARPIPMESVLRGAISRISDYRRVQLHAPVEVAVVGYAAEGVIHLLAELIDNAAQFSPPTEQVHVYVEEAHTGVVVAIEDSGVGMRPRALARAEAAIAAPAGDLSSVSGTRLGLAVVGQLARKYGLMVSYRPSARGGIGVVVMIPRQLVTDEPRLNPVLPSRRGELVAAGSGALRATVVMDAGEDAEEAATEDAPTESDQPFELARRQPGQLLAQLGDRPSTTAKPPTTRTDPGAAFGAFQRAAGEDRQARGDGATGTPETQR